MGIKKIAPNFWDNAPVMTKQEKEQDIKDFGYNPLDQEPKGKERIDN